MKLCLCRNTAPPSRYIKLTEEKVRIEKGREAGARRSPSNERSDHSIRNEQICPNPCGLIHSAIDKFQKQLSLKRPFTINSRVQQLIKCYCLQTRARAICWGSVSLSVARGCTWSFFLRPHNVYCVRALFTQGRVVVAAVHTHHQAMPPGSQTLCIFATHTDHDPGCCFLLQRPHPGLLLSGIQCMLKGSCHKLSTMPI